MSECYQENWYLKYTYFRVLIYLNILLISAGVPALICTKYYSEYLNFTQIPSSTHLRVLVLYFYLESLYLYLIKFQRTYTYILHSKVYLTPMHGLKIKLHSYLCQYHPRSYHFDRFYCHYQLVHNQCYM